MKISWVKKGSFGVVYHGVVWGTKLTVKMFTTEGERQLKPEIHALAKYELMIL